MLLHILFDVAPDGLPEEEKDYYEPVIESVRLKDVVFSKEGAKRTATALSRVDFVPMNEEEEAGCTDMVSAMAHNVFTFTNSSSG